MLPAKKAKEKFRQESIDKLIVLLKDNESRTFWNFFKPAKSLLPASISSNDWFLYFSSLFNPPNTINDNAHAQLYSEMESLIDVVLAGGGGSQNDEPDSDMFEILDQRISENEIADSISYLKNNKSPGIDGIPGEFYKTCSHVLIPLLFKLFNLIFENGIFPSSWCDGIICPIFKSGDKCQAKNYRGITLLPIVSKIYTRILYNRLILWEENCSPLREEQAGFRKGYSTTDNIFILHTFIKKYLSKRGGRFYCAFVDFEKAFDRVDRMILFFKLGKAGLKGKMFKALFAIYKEVKSCVLGREGITDHFMCPHGVRQGCILSPFLFAFFISRVFIYE